MSVGHIAHLGNSQYITNTVTGTMIIRVFYAASIQVDATSKYQKLHLSKLTLRIVSHSTKSL